MQSWIGASLLPVAQTLSASHVLSSQEPRDRGVGIRRALLEKLASFTAQERPNLDEGTGQVQDRIGRTFFQPPSADPVGADNPLRSVLPMETSHLVPEVEAFTTPPGRQRQKRAFVLSSPGDNGTAGSFGSSLNSDSSFHSEPRAQGLEVAARTPLTSSKSSRAESADRGPLTASRSFHTDSSSQRRADHFPASRSFRSHSAARQEVAARTPLSASRSFRSDSACREATRSRMESTLTPYQQILNLNPNQLRSLKSEPLPKNSSTFQATDVCHTHRL